MELYLNRDIVKECFANTHPIESHFKCFDSVTLTTIHALSYT